VKTFNSHYTDTGFQPIQAIENWCSSTQFVGFCAGNILKYIARYDRKGTPLQDIAKATTYADYIVAHYITGMSREYQSSILSRYNLEKEVNDMLDLSHESAVGYLRGSIIENCQQLLRAAQQAHERPIDSYPKIQAAALAENVGNLCTVLYNIISRKLE
jgi:hypothetical protein